MHYPKVYLVMDNCFAIKRWVRPAEWMPVIKDMGVTFVEASTDNEIDPLFSPSKYRDSWLAETKAAQKDLGMTVANFYTGYQTYRTVGLAHHDSRVREHIKNEWFGRLVPLAAELGSGIGFSFHAIPHHALQTRRSFEEHERQLVETYGELAAFAWKQGKVELSCEQMYSPHQTPWKISQTRKFLKDVHSCCGVPFYTTIDVGHMVGQCHFRRPTAEKIRQAIATTKEGKNIGSIWLGPERCRSLLECKAGSVGDAELLQEITNLLDEYDYLFSAPQDSEVYTWLEELGAWSPIIHLQQTDGVTSSHAPFTRSTNDKGIIRGAEVLRALLRSWNKGEQEGMPPRVSHFYLTFELFIANTSYPHDSLLQLRESVEYWRRFIPRDGMDLKELVDALQEDMR